MNGSDEEAIPKEERMSAGRRGVPDHVRREADRLEEQAQRGFRRVASPGDDRRDELLLSAVRRARTGDGDALRFLYLRYRDHVYGYVCSIVQDEHDAEDITQHLFSRL